MESPSTNGHGDFVPQRQLISEMHSMMKDMAKRSDRVEHILFGDKEAEIDGIVHTIKKHGKYISADKKIKWIGAGTVLTGGAGMGFWETIKTLIFK